MMAVIEWDLDKPRAVGLAFHRISRGVPIIEITNQVHLLRAGGVADEVDRFGHFFGRVGIVIAVIDQRAECK